MGRIFGKRMEVKERENQTFFARKVERRFVRGKKIERPIEEEQSESRWRKRRWVLTLLWVLFVGTVVYQVFLSGMLSVEQIDVEGTGLLSVDEVRSAVQEELSGKYLKTISRNNLALVATGRLERKLQANFPLIRQVTVTKVFPHTLVVSLLERGDFLFWCSSDEHCFLLDEVGRILDRPEAFEEYRVPRLFLVDESQKIMTPGDRAVTVDFLHFIRSLSQALLEQSGIRMQERIFLPSKYADEIRVETSEGISLQMNTTIPLEKTLNTLRIVREKAVPKNRLADLVSVDLRVSGKAFYRLRDEAPTEIHPLTGGSE